MHQAFWASEEYITTWQQFDQVIRFEGCRLLKRLAEFPNSVLVSGCQRSGTTMLARIITQSDRMVKYWFGPDDELDAALILSGYVNHRPQGRYCFQTTYINRSDEYLDQPNDFKIIWSLRNPHSVIYSMLYNWSDYALNEVFTDCGVQLLRGKDKLLYKLFGNRGVSRLLRACLAYNGKTAQIFDLKQHFNKDSIIVIDYDELVKNKHLLLRAIYHFIDLEYDPKYAEWIHAKSVGNKTVLFPDQVKRITALCDSVYLRSRELLSKTSDYSG